MRRRSAYVGSVSHERQLQVRTEEIEVGMAHILYIRQDGLNLRNRAETAGAFGEAVLHLCLDIEAKVDAGGLTARRHADLFNCGSCVNWVAEVHSTDETVFLWTVNTLVPLQRHNSEDFQRARELLEEHAPEG